jgi:predicted enzyme related to lactoylglutathione lyase
MTNPASFFEVVGRDRRALEAFYTELFGWQTTDVPGPIEYAMVAPGAEGGIPGGIGATPDGSEGHVTFYAAVDDVSAALQKAESLGGKTALPAMDIPKGQIGLLADPEGHIVGVWRGETSAGDAGGAGSPVVHFEVMGRDGDTLRSFYGELFGWEFNRPGPEMDYGLVDAEEGQGIAGGVGASPQGDGHVMFYVGVDDLQATLDKAESLGGKTVSPPMDVVEGTRIAHVGDPEGHTVGIVSS